MSFHIAFSFAGAVIIWAIIDITPGLEPTKYDGSWVVETLYYLKSGVIYSDLGPIYTIDGLMDPSSDVKLIWVTVNHYLIV